MMFRTATLLILSVTALVLTSFEPSASDQAMAQAGQAPYTYHPPVRPIRDTKPGSTLPINDATYRGVVDEPPPSRYQLSDDEIRGLIKAQVAHEVAEHFQRFPNWGHDSFIYPPEKKQVASESQPTDQGRPTEGRPPNISEQRDIEAANQEAREKPTQPQGDWRKQFDQSTKGQWEKQSAQLQRHPTFPPEKEPAPARGHHTPDHDYRPQYPDVQQQAPYRQASAAYYQQSQGVTGTCAFGSCGAGSLSGSGNRGPVRGLFKRLFRR